MHKQPISEAPLIGKTIHISSKSLWFFPDTCTHLPLHTHTRAALSLMSVFSLRDEWECLYEKLTGHLLLCLRAGCWPRVSSSSLRPSAGYGHQGGFQEGALSPRQANPESSTALGIDTPDLLGDRASKLCNLPNHCTHHKGHWYVNAAAYHRTLGDCLTLCDTSEGGVFIAVYVLFKFAFVEWQFGLRGLDKVPRIPLERFAFPLKAASLFWKTSWKTCSLPIIFLRTVLELQS